MRKISKITVRNYRGIEELDLDVSPAGAIAKGRNGAGKTTLLKAVKACLLAQDVGSDAIRKGANKSEILVDIDDLQVRRVITEKGSRLDVGKGEFLVKAPQTYLKELLGTSTLDPMDLLMLKGKERRAKVLAALPVTVTVEQLRKWWDKCPDNYDCSGHGLDVIATVRDMAYRKRTDTNRVVKEAEQALRQARRVAESIVAPDAEPNLDHLQNVADAARAAATGLRSRHAEAERQIEAMSGNRSKVESLRAKADAIRAEAKPVAEEEIEHATEAVHESRDAVARLRAQLESAEITLRNCERAAIGLHAENERYESAIEQARGIEQQADELESAIESAMIRPVAGVEIAAAELEAHTAQDALAQARADAARIREASAAKKVLLLAEENASKAKGEAERLDSIVKALTNDAPAELLAAADGIQGLTIDGDEVLLDGVRLDALCGAEQIRFCVEVARRANEKSKILICDGLERLDPEAMDVFVQEATRGGYQLLATRVDRGDVVIEAIESGPVESEATEERAVA